MTANNDAVTGEVEKGFVPTRDQKGAFLIALGEEMLRHDLSAGAVLDGHSNTSLVRTMRVHGVDGKIAEQILALNHDELTEAIDESI